MTELELLRDKVSSLSSQVDELRKINEFNEAGRSVEFQVGDRRFRVPFDGKFVFIIFLLFVVVMFGLSKVEELGHAINGGGLGNLYAVSEGEVEGQEKGDQVIYQFWTPSHETKYSDDVIDEYFSGNVDNVPDSYCHVAGEDRIPKYYWVDDGDGQVKVFAETLKRLGAQGLHYSPVSGLGTTGWKDGYFWEVTFDKGVMSRESLVIFYSNYWGRKKKIYMREATVKSTYQGRS